MKLHIFLLLLIIGCFIIIIYPIEYESIKVESDELKPVIGWIPSSSVTTFDVDVFHHFDGDVESFGSLSVFSESQKSNFFIGYKKKEFIDILPETITLFVKKSFDTDFKKFTLKSDFSGSNSYWYFKSFSVDEFIVETSYSEKLIIKIQIDESSFLPLSRNKDKKQSYKLMKIVRYSKYDHLPIVFFDGSKIQGNEYYLMLTGYPFGSALYVGWFKKPPPFQLTEKVTLFVKHKDKPFYKYTSQSFHDVGTTNSYPEKVYFFEKLQLLSTKDETLKKIYIKIAFGDEFFIWDKEKRNKIKDLKKLIKLEKKRVE